jgi:prolyl-tRNA synthetase
MVGDEKPYLVLLRGDHQLSETKFGVATGSVNTRQAHPDEIRDWFAADAGSLGPVGLKTMRILMDTTLEGRKNMICGANRNDYHLRHVTPGEDFRAETHDLRQAEAGDGCTRCGQPLEVQKCIEVGHIFKLGYKYSQSMGLRVLDASGNEVTPIMGSYGIGIERILSAAVELYADESGMSLPPSIAPFFVIITPVNISDSSQRAAAEDLYARCGAARLDALYDDRDERPGVKFKDADLIGIPYRITIGKKLAQGLVEITERRTRRATDVPVSEAAARVATMLAECSGGGRTGCLAPE